jgi:hypothetical protein
MPTLLDATRRSLRLLSVLDPREVPGADDIASARDALNTMMQRWEADGTAVGWTPVQNPTDVLTVPFESVEAIVTNLAVRLAPEYDREPSTTLLGLARDGLEQLLRDRWNEMPVEQTLDTPLGFRTGKYDTLTDTWRR